MVEQPQCTILGCETPPIARGWCWVHYKRWQRHGDPHYALATWHLKPPPPTRPTVAQRFWTKVDFNGPTPTKRGLELGQCWLWTGATGGLGYGHCWTGSQQEYSHRWAYEFCVGPIPEGLELDHLCETPLCVRPDHLEAVTHRVNTLRSATAVAAINARKTHCKRGHEFTEENTYPLKYKNEAGRQGRMCRACNTISVRAYRQRRREMLHA